MIFIAGYPIDAALSEDHNLSNEITSDPVEGGSDVTDNARVLPDEVSYDCIVSDRPRGLVAAARSSGGQFTTTSPSIDAYRRMRELRAARTLVTVVDSFGQRDNMMVASVTITRKAEGGRALRFTLKLKQVVVVTNERTIVKVSVARAAKLEQRTKPVVAAPAAKYTRNTDLLWKGLH